MLLNKRKRNPRVKFNPGLSANRPSFEQLGPGLQTVFSQSFAVMDFGDVATQNN